MNQKLKILSRDSEVNAQGMVKKLLEAGKITTLHLLERITQPF